MTGVILLLAIPPFHLDWRRAVPRTYADKSAEFSPTLDEHCIEGKESA